LVHGKRKLLLGSADTIGAIFACGGIARNAFTELAALVAADSAEGGGELLARDVRLGDTSEALFHAAAEIRVGRRRERRGGGEPVLSSGWARLKRGVCGVVVGLLGARGCCRGKLLGEVAVVFKSLGVSVVDRDQT
jgi:hypothetical protein